MLGGLSKQQKKSPTKSKVCEISISIRIFHRLLGNLRYSGHSIARGIGATLAYLTTSVVLLGAIALMETEVDASQLRSFLAYVLITTIAAGLEPGTAKTALLNLAGAKNASVSTAMVVAGLLKSVMASPIIAVFWLIMEGPSALGHGLIFVPLITALGFIATDVRVILDANSRHTAAIMLKQGSLSLGIGVPAVAMALGCGLMQGVIVGCVLRLIWTTSFILTLSVERGRAREFVDHLRAKAWVHFLIASCVGSLSASIDRLIAIRMLDASTASAYVLAYEILSKFWLLPYLLAPVVFVKVSRDGLASRVPLQCNLLIATAAVPFLLSAGVITFIPLDIIQAANFTWWVLSVFAAAIVLASFNQILAAEQQASGREAAVTRAALSGLVVSATAFPSLLAWMGLNGLVLAWLMKSLTELIALRWSTLKKMGQIDEV